MSIPKNSKQDWDVVTGWEKRIKVDFGSLGPNHVRWSHWTYKERDIVARKIHEITDIGDIHGNRSKKADDWRKENAPIIVDFARDGKPMPDWAHAEYRESGVPEHIQVIWKRENPNDPASKGDWDYEKPGPWDKGEEPAWSSKPKDPEYTGYMDKKYGGVMSYTENKETGDRFDTNGNLISTRESRAKEDVPNWRKFELGRLEDVDGQWVPGPNALPKDIEQYGENIAKTGRAKTMKPTKIMPGDTNHTPLEKALNWASESHHGKAHQNRWNRVWLQRWAKITDTIRIPLMKLKRYGNSLAKIRGGRLQLTGLILTIKMLRVWLNTILHRLCRATIPPLILKSYGIKNRLLSKSLIGAKRLLIPKLGFRLIGLMVNPRAKRLKRGNGLAMTGRN